MIDIAVGGMFGQQTIYRAALNVVENLADELVLAEDPTSRRRPDPGDREAETMLDEVGRCWSSKDVVGGRVQLVSDVPYRSDGRSLPIRDVDNTEA